MKMIHRLFKWLCIAMGGGALLYMGWLLMRAFLVDQFIIPTESMEPTLMPGDRVIVNKAIMGARIYSDFHFNQEGIELKSWRTRGLRRLQHNDIVVFNFPKHDDKINFVINHVYAKRCVALPGDTISIVNGRYVNNNYEGTLGLESEQTRLANISDSIIDPSVLYTFPYDAQPLSPLPPWGGGPRYCWTIKEMGPLYVPRKGDRIRITPKEANLYRHILEWETGKEMPSDTIAYHTFQHNYYYLCGDNVLNSCDARYWGFVPEEYIVGIVTHITYSINSYTGKRRKERTLKHV